MLLGLLTAATVASTSVAVNSSDAPDSGAQTDRARIEQIVHDYILAHPEILPQAMERLKDKRMTEVVNTRRKEIETPYAGAWEGAKDADVTVVEFFDYRCSFCKLATPAVVQLIKENPDVRFVFKEFVIFGAASETAARGGKPGSKP